MIDISAFPMAAFHAEDIETLLQQPSLCCVSVLSRCPADLVRYDRHGCGARCIHQSPTNLRPTSMVPSSSLPQRSQVPVWDSVSPMAALRGLGCAMRRKKNLLATAESERRRTT